MSKINRIHTFEFDMTLGTTALGLIGWLKSYSADGTYKRSTKPNDKWVVSHTNQPSGKLTFSCDWVWNTNNNGRGQTGMYVYNRLHWRYPDGTSQYFLIRADENTTKCQKEKELFGVLGDVKCKMLELSGDNSDIISSFDKERPTNIIVTIYEFYSNPDKESNKERKSSSATFSLQTSISDKITTLRYYIDFETSKGGKRKTNRRRRNKKRHNKTAKRRRRL